jgi:hypothetical protein
MGRKRPAEGRQPLSAEGAAAFNPKTCKSEAPTIARNRRFVTSPRVLTKTCYASSAKRT